MIPAPRFDYQAAATPGGIYQGLGALAEAATTAHAVRRKAQQDQVIAQQQEQQEQQKHAMGLARLQAEDTYRANMLKQQEAELQQRRVEHGGRMAGEWLDAGTKGLESVRKFFTPDPSQAAQAAQARYYDAGANLKNVQAEAAKNKPAAPPMTVSNQIELEKLDADEADAELARIAQETRKARIAYDAAPETVPQGFLGVDTLWPDSVTPFEKSEAFKRLPKPMAREDLIAGIRAKRRTRLGVGALASPTPTPTISRTDGLRAELQDRFGGNIPAEYAAALESAESDDAAFQELQELLQGN